MNLLYVFKEVGHINESLPHLFKKFRGEVTGFIYFNTLSSYEL